MTLGKGLFLSSLATPIVIIVGLSTLGVVLGFKGMEQWYAIVVSSLIYGFFAFFILTIRVHPWQSVSRISS